MLYNVDLAQWYKKNWFLLKLIDRADRYRETREFRTLTAILGVLAR